MAVGAVILDGEIPSPRFLRTNVEGAVIIFTFYV